MVDRDVTHSPTDHDFFYLPSHAEILGTRRLAHYSVRKLLLIDTHMICSRAKTHFEPTEHLKFERSTAVSGSTTNIETFKDGYIHLHTILQKAHILLAVENSTSIHAFSWSPYLMTYPAIRSHYQRLGINSSGFFSERPPYTQKTLRQVPHTVHSLRHWQ